MTTLWEDMMLNKSLLGLGALAAMRAGCRAGQRAAAADQDRADHAVFRPVRRHGDADGQRDQALREAARRHRRRPQDRVHPQGYRRHRAGCRQAPRAGAGGARQRRHPGRLRADAERDGGGRRLGRGEEVHGGDERRDRDHHHEVALHGAHLDHRAADDRDVGDLGRHEGRHQEGLHDGLRLRPGP